MRSRLRLYICLGALAALAAAGCGATGDETPAACLDGTGAYLGALGDAPGQVRLSGEVPISDCLAENQPGGELATVGTAMVAAATRLSAEARANPDGPAALRLGYLVGAAERGAEGTGGIHSDLLRRLQAAARYAPQARQLPDDFERGYREGAAAGRISG